MIFIQTTEYNNHLIEREHVQPACNPNNANTLTIIFIPQYILNITLFQVIPLTNMEFLFLAN